jgi:hypothetical protein
MKLPESAKLPDIAENENRGSHPSLIARDAR